MKVTYYFREKRDGVFSIEELYNNLISEIEKSVQVNKFYCEKSKITNLKNAPFYKGDINHITGDINYLAFSLPSKNTIITIHDIGHYEVTLKAIKKVLYYYLWLKAPLSKVKYITAISEFTKSRVVEALRIPPEKIKVIYNPCPKGFNYKPKSFNKDYPSILQIGSGRNKNIDRLIESIKGMKCKLLLLRKYNLELDKKLKDYQIDFEFFPNLNYEDVLGKYQECDMVYFASTYEGFGLPIIEANAVGRPVITSNIASMPEVAGNSAYLVNPYDVNDIKKGIQRIIEDDHLRNNLIENGLENVKRFKLENIAQQYLKLYKEISQG